MSRVCPKCGFANYEGMRRCAQCGNLLEEEERRAPVGAGGPEVVAKGRDPLAAALLSFLLPGGGQMYNEQVLKGEVIFLTSPLLLPWLYGILDAYRVASRFTSMALIRSPGWATLLGHMIPGAGQVYNRQWGKALLVFATSPFILPWVLGIFDANRTAKRINTGLLPLAPPLRSRTLLMIVLVALAAMVLVLWIVLSWWGRGPTSRFPI
jgi:TM2 domain-containing membrane protein YozV